MLNSRRKSTDVLLCCDNDGNSWYVPAGAAPDAASAATLNKNMSATATPRGSEGRAVLAATISTASGGAALAGHAVIGTVGAIGAYALHPEPQGAFEIAADFLGRGLRFFIGAGHVFSEAYDAGSHAYGTVQFIDKITGSDN